MKDYITLVGTVGTVPRHYYTANEVEATSFRLVTNNRKFNDATGQWEDGNPCWYTVKAYRGTGRNAHASIELGQRIVVYGALRVSQWKREDGTTSTLVQVDADALGHNLAFGTTRFMRNPRQERVDGGLAIGSDEAIPATGTDGTGAPTSVEYVDAGTGEVLRPSMGSSPDAATQGYGPFMEAGQTDEAAGPRDDDDELDGEEPEEDAAQAS